MEAIAGWDRESREYFLYVFDLRPDSPSRVLWSNLVCFHPSDRFSTDRLQSHLRRMIRQDPPDGFWREVEKKGGERLEWDGAAWSSGLDMTVPRFISFSSMLREAIGPSYVETFSSSSSGRGSSHMATGCAI